MKTIYITIALALVSIQLSAQEKMKVELKSGQTVEYNVDDVKRVYFDESNVPTDFKVTPSSVSMYYDGTKQLSAPGATSWKTSNDFVAGVDNNGLVTGRHIGTTQITASDGKSSDICTVTIKPKYSLYDTPILNWGYSKSQIKSLETHSLLEEKDESVYYNYSFGSTTCILSYGFKEGKLNAILLMMPFKSSLLLNTAYYITERFQPFYKDGDNFWFIDAMDVKDSKTALMFNSDSSSTRDYVDVYYTDSSPLKTSGSRTRSTEQNADKQKIMEHMKELIKTL